MKTSIILWAQNFIKHADIKSALMIISVITIISLAIWIAWSLYAIKSLEEPKYTIISKKTSYELRQYSDYIVAEVEVSWNQNDALNNWFRLLAWYIFGWNKASNSIAMTAPVSETELESTQIAMTVPVSETQTSANKRIVQFSMPSKYTLDSLPEPNDSRVQLKEIPWYKAAVLSYTWYATEKRVASKKEKLKKLLKENNIEIIWEMTSAQYNPPFSFPLLRRNEMIVRVK